MTLPPDLADKDALIATLVARAEEQILLIAQLTAKVAELEAKLGAPPKGPDNSSVPPSRGQKASGSGRAKAKRRPHRGAHRALHLRIPTLPATISDQSPATWTDNYPAAFSDH